MKKAIFGLCLLLCLFSFPAIAGETNAVDTVVKRSSGLGWTAPEVLEGEPALTGYTIYWASENNTTNATVFQSFVLTNGNDLVVSGPTNSYYWPEYPIDEVPNTKTEVWFWVTASNEVGAVSQFSEPCSLTLDLREPRKPMNLEIHATTNGVSVTVNEIPSDVESVEVAVSEDMKKWLTGTKVAMFRATNK